MGEKLKKSDKVVEGMAAAGGELKMIGDLVERPELVEAGRKLKKKASEIKPDPADRRN